MRKLQIEKPEGISAIIQQEIMHLKESRYTHRLHAILLVANGFSCTDVARIFTEDVRTIQRWITRFDQYGLPGLRNRERPGRPRSLDEKQWKALSRDLRRRPSKFGYEQDIWDGKIVGEHIMAQYGVSLGIRQCQRILSSLPFD